ncbi:o-succinylbenzoate synthase [Pasteurellaceae bacterium RH1A]|nr:o-succinylbenzoate synthase [Pasteurellaceae bacterium RH1A]
MRQAKLYSYSIPFQSSLILRGREISHRQGLILHLEQGNLQGWGEIAPLVGFSQESLEEATEQAIDWCRAWQTGQAEGDLDRLVPSVAFGISCALAELDQSLGLEADFGTVPLCLSELDFPKLEQARLAKIKVGLQAVEKEGKFANDLLNRLPQLKLRLDANRKWSLEQALAFAQEIEAHNRTRFDFIEEPCPSPDLSRNFAQQTGLPLAWDESVREPGFIVRAEPHLSALVLKPSLIGSLDRCIHLIQQAHQAGLQAVISSSLESSLGLTQLARIAKQYTPETLAGLDTLNLMGCQIIRGWQGRGLPIVGVDGLIRLF